MDRGESEHGGCGRHVKRKPAAQHTLQKQFGVHLIHPESILGSPLECGVLIFLQAPQGRFVFLLEGSKLLG